MKLNLTAKFLLPIFLLLISLTILLSLLVTSVLRDSMLNRAATFVADIVRLQAQNHITGPSVFTKPTKESEQVFKKLQSEVKTPEVIRIKVWNSHKTVIYSDDNSIVGKTFSDNDELTDALEGKIKTDVTAPTKNENIGEKKYSQLMEVYVPIYLNNSKTLNGVVETYYTLDALNTEILQAQTKVVEFIILVFLALAIILWILLHFLVIHPLRTLEKATKEIEKGNLDTRVSIHSRDEIGSLATSFNSMTEGLKRLQELKNEFVFIGAHELRTPVTAMNSFIYLLFKLDESKNMSDKMRHYLESIQRVSDRLAQLVNDILEIARNDAGKIEIKLEPVSIENEIQELVQELRPLSDKKQITINYSQPTRDVQVLADKGKLKEVLMNLISNAIKYGNESGYINITSELTESSIITHVTNNGVGIPKDEQQQIFSKFFRAGNVRTEDYTGTGLGLFITKELVDKMNGKIWFTSEENKETTFSVEFQLANTKTV